MLTVNFTPFPNLSTERLLLRQMTSQDDTDLFALRSDTNIMRFIPRPLARSVNDSSQLIQSLTDAIRNNESITWAITLKNDSNVIGTIGFVRMAKEHYRAEIGYLLSADYQGQGLMQEALTAVVDYGFQTIKLHSIEAIVNSQNTASANVLVRAGFKKEAHFKENQFYGGQFHDSIHYSLLTPLH